MLFFYNFIPQIKKNISNQMSEKCPKQGQSPLCCFFVASSVYIDVSIAVQIEQGIGLSLTLCSAVCCFHLLINN